MPACRWASSPSLSLWLGSGGWATAGDDRWACTEGGSSSPLRGGGRFGRLRSAAGGGDRNRGETGQRGPSFKCSAVTGDFCGAAALTVASICTGPRSGVAVAWILPPVGALGVVCLDARDGLVSCGACFRDLVLEALGVDLGSPERSNGRSGEVSWEGEGESLGLDV